ncbi:MAG TPA: septum site-determining protein MinC, partial [Accumulibacter sp.]|nr:septum site-determining protein MinC [Accumulibacter sp.]
MLTDSAMSRARQTSALIEFKGTTLPVVIITLRTLHWQKLAEAAQQLFGDDDFFDGDAALLELSALEDAAGVDWTAIKKVLQSHGLNVIGVRGGSEPLRQSAAAAGLPTYAASERLPRPSVDEAGSAPPADAATSVPMVEVDTTAATEPSAPSDDATTPKETAVSETAAPAAAPLPTLFVDRPLRSGQQVYARGAHLVMMAAVNAGAEVIADGDIHIYAPLHGRALAGASGATHARIFCTRFDAELVSIAGFYRTFEDGMPASLAGKPAQVRLQSADGEQAEKLLAEPL